MFFGGLSYCRLSDHWPRQTIRLSIIIGQRNPTIALSIIRYLGSFVLTPWCWPFHVSALVITWSCFVHVSCPFPRQNYPIMFPCKIRSCTVYMYWSSPVYIPCTCLRPDLVCQCYTRPKARLCLSHKGKKTKNDEREAAIKAELADRRVGVGGNSSCSKIVCFSLLILLRCHLGQPSIDFILIGLDTIISSSSKACGRNSAVIRGLDSYLSPACKFFKDEIYPII
jgi:hypothetical protein